MNFRRGKGSANRRGGRGALRELLGDPKAGGRLVERVGFSHTRTQRIECRIQRQKHAKGCFLEIAITRVSEGEEKKIKNLS